MEGVPKINTNPNPNYYDKSVVLDVKPLRSLKPVFQNGTQGPPFAPPLVAQQPNQDTPDLNQTPPPPPPTFVQPLRTFRSPPTPESNIPSSSNGTKKGPVGRPKGSVGSKKKSIPNPKKPKLDIQVAKTSNFDSGISLSEREDGNSYLVSNVLTRFDAVRRRLTQVDCLNANLKAAGILMSNGVRTNTKKRVGTVPGISVGDIFFSRIEMCLVGLHMQTMAGIDYITSKNGVDEEPLATSIVSSGRYDNETEDPEVLIYSGQGGNADKNGQSSDQKLVRGNLALERSLRNGNGVRVIRGEEDGSTKRGKIYIYDGVYLISESWVEKGKSGCNTFKYKLVRVPGQPSAFGVWKSVEKWKEGLITRTGLILPDLTSGAEDKPVSLVNDVDDEKGPAYFTYISSLRSVIGSSCNGMCSPGNLNCSCVTKNGGYLPYLSGNMLVSRRPMIYECCPCYVNCKNRVVQTGLKFRLEVFKTSDRGWGLRSWEPIRAGSFICEYAGEVKGKEEDYEYLFDTSRVYKSFKWNYEPKLVDEDPSVEVSEEFSGLSPVLISSKNFGNVARFMNHSCSPNVLWQPVVCEGNGGSVVHIAFFAIRHIPPMAELMYDYGVSPTSTGVGKRKCLCGAEECRGSFG